MLLKDSKTTNTSRSILWGMINKILSILLPFAVRTEIILFLGIEYTGLESLFTSILTVLSLAELGFGSALVFSMYKPVAENDIAKVNAYLNYYKKCYRVIGFVVLTIGIIVLPFLPKLINGNPPDSMNVYILYGIYLLNTVLSYFLCAYKTSILVATQRNDIVSKIASAILVISSIIQIVLLAVFKNYYVYVIVLPVKTILNNLIIAVVTKRIYPEIHAVGELKKDEKEIVYQKVKGLMFQQMGSIILTSADTIVISAFLGLTVLGTYNNYYYIITALFGFFGVIQTSLYPSIGNSMQTETTEKNYADFKFFHFVYILCVFFCTACLMSLLQPFMKIWIGEKMMLDMPMVVLLVIYFYTHKMSDICSIYRNATGMFEVWKLVPFIAGIFNLFLNIVLTQFIGLYGIVLSTISAMVLIYLPFYCYPVIKRCFKSTKKYWLYIGIQLFYMLCALVIVTVVYFITLHIDVDGVRGFIIKMFVTVFLSAFLLCLVSILSPYRTRLIQMIRRVKCLL